MIALLFFSNRLHGYENMYETLRAIVINPINYSIPLYIINLFTLFVHAITVYNNILTQAMIQLYNYRSCYYLLLF